MKKLAAAAVLIAVLSIPAFGDTPAKTEAAVTTAEPSVVIPVYPGSTQVMEVSLTEKDMLNWITQVLPAMAAMSAGSKEGLLGRINQLDLQGLAQALQGLKVVKVQEFSLPKSGTATPQRIVDYYTTQLRKESGWTRVFWRSDSPQKALAVYSLPNAEGIFITSVKTSPEGGKLLVGRTAGRVDLAKITEWAAKNFGAFMGEQDKAAGGNSSE